MSLNMEKLREDWDEAWNKKWVRHLIPEPGARRFEIELNGVTAAGYLLEQAVIAISKLENLVAEKAVKDSSLKEFIAEHSEARFFDNKRITAQYFVEAIVPEAEALMAGAKTQNYEALDINF